MSDDPVRDKVRLYVADVTPAQLPSFGGVAVRRRRRRLRQALGTAGTVAVGVLAVVVGALATRGASGTPAATGGDLASQLVGRTWDLTALTVDGTTTPVPTGLAWSLTLGHDTFTGNDGCNGQFGSVSYQETTIRVGSAGSTLVGCAPDERPWEQAFEVLESGRASATVAGDTLTLSVGGEVLALAARSPTSTAPVASATGSQSAGPSSSPAPGLPSRPATTAGPPAGLGAGKWLLESSTVNGVTTRAGAGGRPPWIQFSADRVMASDGCNGYSAWVSYEGTTVRPVDGGQVTYVDCAGDPQAVGNAYIALLAHPIQVYVYDDGQRLTLSGDNLALSLHRDTGVQPSATALALINPTWKLELVTATGVH